MNELLKYRCAGEFDLIKSLSPRIRKSSRERLWPFIRGRRFAHLESGP